MVSSRSRSAPRAPGTDRCHPRDAGTGGWHGVDESLPRLSQAGEICRLPRNRPPRERRVLQKVWFRRPARRSTHRHIDLVYVAAAKRAASRRLTEQECATKIGSSFERLITSSVVRFTLPRDNAGNRIARQTSAHCQKLTSYITAPTEVPKHD